MSSEARSLLGIQDLTAEDARWILDRAAARQQGEGPSDSTLLAGLLFLSPSLRTRVGFAAAVARLGGRSIEVSDPRWDPTMSAEETFEDTIRTIAGMVDIVVFRGPVVLDSATVSSLPSPVVNAGDGSGRHPTQALVDLFAIEQLAGPVNDLRIGIQGDLTMRACRSFLRLLNLFPPAQLILIGAPRRTDHGVDLTDALASRVSWRSPGDLSELDVLSMIGLPPMSGSAYLDEDLRRSFALTSDVAATLGADATVLSPMPVIDEIDDETRADPRVRMFKQSDLSLHVRSAVLEWALGGG